MRCRWYFALAHRSVRCVVNENARLQGLQVGGGKLTFVQPLLRFSGEEVREGGEGKEGEEEEEEVVVVGVDVVVVVALVVD